MEDDLTRIYLEANGGGQNMESYDLPLYFAVHHVVSDAWEKRQRKGYLFITGDEQVYPNLDAGTIHRIFGGERPSKDFPIEQLVKDAQERYHVYFVIPGGANNSTRTDLHDHWAKHLGADHVIHLDDVSQICDVVALVIGLNEGTATGSVLETFPKATQTALDPVLAAAQKTIDKAASTGKKTARL